MIRDLKPILIMFFYVIFRNIIIVIIIALFYYIDIFNFFFFCLISLFVPYSYVSVGSINCILLSLLALTAILLTSSVNTLCFSPLNLYCDFIFSMNSLGFSFRLFVSSLFFCWWFYFQVDLSLDNFYNLQV